MLFEQVPGRLERRIIPGTKLLPVKESRSLPPDWGGARHMLRTFRIHVRSWIRHPLPVPPPGGKEQIGSRCRFDSTLNPMGAFPNIVWICICTLRVESEANLEVED